jgi:type IV pilus assembly protein PilA
MRLREGKRGFTLIELMIVVAIVGILAVLAVYGVRKYITNVKAAEGRNGVGQIAKDAYAAYQKEGMKGTVLAPSTTAGASNTLCLSASNAIPSTITKVSGQKYQSLASEWNVDEAANKGFACLHFQMEMPQYYVYSYAADSAGTTYFTGFANGDVNGDGTYSTYLLSGSVQAGVLTIAPNMYELSPE